MAFYSDINHQDPLNDATVEDLESIYQAIDNILNTQPKDRMFLPEFGTDLNQFLFAPMDQGTKFQIKNEIIKALRRWEPRIDVNRQASYVKGFADSHEIELQVVFSIKGLTETEYVYQSALSKNDKGQYYAV